NSDQETKRDSATAIYALDADPFQHKLCFANASDNVITQLCYNHNANFIAVGYSNGELTLCGAL
ncbi:unnamed protein product, partial [Rotaria sp. Silwood1]